MKKYDLVVIGTGSAMNIVDPMLRRNPSMKVAVIDKDDPGGICLTRGCIPTKILLYPAELFREIERAPKFGIDVEVKKVDFEKVMGRMRKLIDRDIEMIRKGLSHAPNIDYYPHPASFVAPYTLKVAGKLIKGDMIFLCTGSKPYIPPIKGLEKVGYHTSDTILRIKKQPKSLIIVGGGYIAAEFGHFFSAMGTDVTIVGRNPQFLPQEEPEISALVKREMSKYLRLVTNHEVVEVEKGLTGKKKVIAINRATGKRVSFTAEEILIAAGRASNSDILHPEKGGIKTDKKGWIIVNEYLETSQPNVWAFGDAIGVHLFKHVANYESLVVYYNAVLKRRMKVDYHAVPHAVFTYPEVASVGMREKEAIMKYGEKGILIGIERYEDTAKGEAMGVKDYFVKVIVKRDDMRILGAHIIGPQASVLIQEIINLMYTEDESAYPLMDAMHIHPALSEVVERAFGSLMPPKHYHHVLTEHFGLPEK
ncbi:MAG: dihydrolipoyl dehydrogenase [Thermoplasmata archaeon]|nr:dihydrolipoyl dehydrogenase [Thermoplasmata archaeon]